MSVVDKIEANTRGYSECLRVMKRAGRLWAPGRTALLRIFSQQQDRLSLWFPVIFGAGIVIYFSQMHEPSGLSAAMLAGIGLLVALAGRQWYRVFAGAMVVFALCAGFAVADWRTARVAAPVLEKDANWITIEGVLLSRTSRAEGGDRLVIAPDQFGDMPADRIPARVRINVRTQGDEARPGDIVRVSAGLMPPPGPAAPGAFDFGRQAYFRQLGAVGYARSPLERVAEAPDNLSTGMSHGLARLRNDLTARIIAALPLPRGAVAAALMTGDRGGIPEKVLSDLRDAGLAHLLAISGLHMALFAGALFWLVRALLALIPGLSLRAPIKKWAAAIALLGAFGYLLISGASVATQRAFIMFTLIFVAVILDRPAITMRNVALAAFIVLALAPESIMEASFQMSFAAAVALVAFYEAARPWLSQWNAALAERGVVAKLLIYVAGIGLTSLVASAATAPFAAYHFNRVVDFGLVANLAAVPIVGIVVMPAALVAFIAMPLGLEALPLWVAGQGIAAILWIADQVASWPGAISAIPAMPAAALAWLALGGLWMCLWRGGVRWFGLAGLVAGVLIAIMAPRPHLLVDREGELVALRNATGALTLSDARKASFSAELWLRRDADLRSQQDATLGNFPRGMFACDRQGCLVDDPQLGRVALPDSWGAVVEDCMIADFVVTHMYAPRRCRAPYLLDRRALLRGGAHAVYLNDTDRRGRAILRIVSTCDITGDRPWTRCRR